MMSNPATLFRCQKKPLTPFRSFRELLQGHERQNTPEYVWLAILLKARPHLSQKETKTEVSVFDVDSDGTVSNTRVLSPPNRNYTSEWWQSSRKPDDRVRIVYVGIENEQDFDAVIIDSLAMEYNLDPKFFFDHLLPSLWSDRRIPFGGQRLSWVPPVPSEQYLRFKDSEGRNISAVLVRADVTDAANKTVIILGPIEAKVRPPERYESQLYPKNTPTPAMYNGSEYLYPVLHLLNREYTDFLHNLKLLELHEKNIAAHRRRVVATEERLRYCLRSLTILGDHRNPETLEIEDYVRDLLDSTKQLKEDADDWLEKETRRQNKEAAQKNLETAEKVAIEAREAAEKTAREAIDAAEKIATDAREVAEKTAREASEAAEKNLQTAIEARDEARRSTELAKNVWRLTLLAFIFIPLNFVSSAFAMHLRLVGFHESDGALPTWPFFAIAVPLELLVLFLFGVMSGYIVKTWRGCIHVVRWVWMKLRRACGTGTTSGDVTHGPHIVADQA